MGGLDGEGDVLSGQVVVDGDRCRRALAGGGDDLRPGVDGVAGSPDPVDARTASGVDDRETCGVEIRAERGEEVVWVRRDVGPNEHCGAGHDLAVGEFDAGEPIVFDDEPGDFAVNDADAAGVGLDGFGGGRFLGVGEVEDVVGPLADELRVQDRAGVGADDPEGFVADLPAVAVGAVEEVASPALADTG